MKIITAKCSCGYTKNITERSHKININKYGNYKCLSCIIKKRGKKNSKWIQNKTREMNNGLLNHDKMKVKCVVCNNVIIMQYSSLKMWKKRHNSDNYICGNCLNKAQDRSKSKSAEHRHKCSERSKKYWENPIYREKLCKHLAKVRSLGPGPSSLERALWRLLDDIEVKYVSAKDGESFTLGPWSFDIMIPKSEFNSNKNLLLEVDGFYRHSRDDVVGYDKAKETYVYRYHNDNYTLERILEHEFLVPGKLKARIMRILGILVATPKHIELDNSLSVKIINFESSITFLGAYHYLGFVNKRGIPIGCFYQDKLIAVALFAGITRDQTAKRLGLKQYECRELIRFCISPDYHNPNFGSWLLSKAIKIIISKCDNLKAIITFADETAEHTGSLYRAANFTYDGDCSISYAYVNADGWVMHKKTMWDHAKKNNLSEKQMAEHTGYTKIKSKSKHRFIYWIK